MGFASEHMLLEMERQWLVEYCHLAPGEEFENGRCQTCASDYTVVYNPAEALPDGVACPRCHHALVAPAGSGHRVYVNDEDQWGK